MHFIFVGVDIILHLSIMLHGHVLCNSAPPEDMRVYWSLFNSAVGLYEH